MAEIVYSQPLFSEALRGFVSLGKEYEHNALEGLGYQRDTVVIGLHYEL